MNKILQLLIMLATILIGSKASFAQSINDKAIFEKTFKDVSKKIKLIKPIDMYLQMQQLSSLIMI